MSGREQWELEVPTRDRPVTCPECGDVAMFYDDHVWTCES